MDMPFKDKEFGVVYCSHVLELLPSVRDCEVAINEMNRVANEMVICSRTNLWIGNWMSSNLKQWISQDSRNNIHIVKR